MKTTNYYIGSIVNFTKQGIYIEVISNADTEKRQLYGGLLLISEYVFSLRNDITVDKGALDILIQTVKNIDILDNQIINISKALQEYYNWKSSNVIYSINNTTDSDLQIERRLKYDLLGILRPSSKFKGFGLQGRNVELCSVLSCLLTIKFIIDNTKNEDDKKVIINLIHKLATKIDDKYNTMESIKVLNNLLPIYGEIIGVTTDSTKEKQDIYKDAWALTKGILSLHKINSHSKVNYELTWAVLDQIYNNIDKFDKKVTDYYEEETLGRNTYKQHLIRCNDTVTSMYEIVNYMYKRDNGGENIVRKHKQLINTFYKNHESLVESGNYINHLYNDGEL